MVVRRIVLFAILGAMSSAASCDRMAPTGSAADRVVIETPTGAKSFTIEFADNDEERTVGLMHRTELAENAGMLFDFGPEPRPVSMWMKNTLIPLDMAFIAADGRIVRIASMTTPLSLTPVPSGQPVRAVLEVKGGRLAELGVKAGDIVAHPIFASP